MKLPAHKGKFALLIIYVIVVFLAPLYSIVSYNPEKAVSMFSKFIDEKDDQFFREYMSLLRDQKVDEAFGLLSPEAQQVVTRDSIADGAKEFSTASSEVILVGVNINHINDSSPRTVYRMSYEMPNNHPERKYVGVNISARDQGQGIRIDAIQTFYSEQSIKGGAKFKFPPIDWALFVAILAPLFVAYTAFRYLTKATQPKWLIFLGIILLSVYVTLSADGGFSLNFSVSGFMGPAGLWGPWVFFPVVPIGAIIYYFFRKRLEISTSSNP